MPPARPTCCSRHWALLSLLLLGLAARAQGQEALELARDGRTEYSILVSPSATKPERLAAAELASFLERATGARFPQVRQRASGPAILVGWGEHLAQRGIAEEFGKWGQEELLIRTHGTDLLLSGGRPRGTLYAVYTFLEDYVGCRWWSSTASTVPRRRSLIIPPVNRRERPAFEYREVFYFDAFDANWAVRNRVNGDRARLGDEHGGQVTYEGFVHTFEEFVPVSEHFEEHPEWFSEIRGKRVRERPQLCLTNSELKTFMAEHIIARLRKNPKANIVSVSQNDWANPCQCGDCAALAALEESQAGPLLHFVNAVSESVEKVFPQVAISTLAYKYTRKPPRYVRPRHNVIVRLCSIECNFLEPLTDGPSNEAFRQDILDWAKVTRRLYVWDYVTDFSHYVQPHPNLRVLGPNVRFFANHNVKGLFEQGNYHSQGGEFAELRAWVLAKLMWQPDLDDRKLISEFLTGYYGAAAPHVKAYIDLIHDAAEESRHFLTYASPPYAPFFTLTNLRQGEAFFDEAEEAVSGDPEILRRVKVCRLPLQYVWISQWDRLWREAKETGTEWPFGNSRERALKSFTETAADNDVRFIREGALLASFVAQPSSLPRRKATPPALCRELPKDAWIDLQDNLFTLHRPNRCVALKADDSASDGAAAWMPGDHHEWATQCETGRAGLGGLPGKPYASYAMIRCEVAGKTGAAFSYGLYDVATRKILSRKYVSAAEIRDAAYHPYEIGTFPMHSAMYLWVAPAANPENVPSVWVDRFFLVDPLVGKKP